MFHYFTSILADVTQCAYAFFFFRFGTNGYVTQAEASIERFSYEFFINFFFVQTRLSKSLYKLKKTKQNFATFFFIFYFFSQQEIQVPVRLVYKGKK